MRGVASLAVRWQAFFLLPRTVSRAPAARPPRGAPRAPRARARTGKRPDVEDSIDALSRSLGTGKSTHITNDSDSRTHARRHA